MLIISIFVYLKFKTVFMKDNYVIGWRAKFIEIDSKWAWAWGYDIKVNPTEEELKGMHRINDKIVKLTDIKNPYTLEDLFDGYTEDESGIFLCWTEDAEGNVRNIGVTDISRRSGCEPSEDTDWLDDADVSEVFLYYLDGITVDDLK